MPPRSPLGRWPPTLAHEPRGGDPDRFGVELEAARLQLLPDRKRHDPDAADLEVRGQVRPLSSGQMLNRVALS